MARPRPSETGRGIDKPPSHEMRNEKDEPGQTTAKDGRYYYSMQEVLRRIGRS